MDKLFNIFWFPWCDIVLFNYEGDAFLIQGRKHKYTNRKRFRVRKVNNMGLSYKPTYGAVTMDMLNF